MLSESRKLQGRVVQWKRVDATFGKRAQNATLSGYDRSGLHNIQNCRICLNGIVEANSIVLSRMSSFPGIPYEDMQRLFVGRQTSQ
jgi:hypothetical protein